jgi:hypothetical protein
VSQPLLLDEMFSDDIARQLRAKGYDVISVVADPALVGLPDDQVLAHAATEGRALVTASIKDFVPLDGRYRAAGRAHAGLILVSAKAFPQNRGFPPRSQPPSPRCSATRPRSSPARCYSSPGVRPAQTTASPISHLT